jgi:hypothetical protein
MQFGKIHGQAFIIFGLILLAAQGFLFLHAKTMTVSPAPAANTQMPQQERQPSNIPAVIGTISLVVGAGLYMVNRNKPQE